MASLRALSSDRPQPDSTPSYYPAGLLRLRGSNPEYWRVVRDVQIVSMPEALIANLGASSRPKARIPKHLRNEQS